MTDIKNADMPASPTESISNGGAPYYKELKSNGLTKREAFAMAAMQNVITTYNPWEQGDFDSSNYEEAAKQAVGLADALLKELSK